LLQHSIIQINCTHNFFYTKILFQQHLEVSFLISKKLVIQEKINIKFYVSPKIAQNSSNSFRNSNLEIKTL